MEEIRLEFYRVHEVGEYASPFIEEDQLPLTLEMKSVPRYKDQFWFGDQKYYAHDVIYNMHPTNGEYNVTVKMYRKAHLHEMKYDNHQ